MSYNIAIVGATGAVGREMLQTLSERKFPVGNVYALGSKSSIGREVSFGEDKVLKVSSVDNFDFNNADIALFSAGSETAKKFAPIAGKKGCIVIDNSSCFRMDEGVPLIVPEVNPDAVNSFNKKNIIANPNCSTIQLVVALKPLHDNFEITRVVVSTYQAVSGAGKPAMDELFNQTKGGQLLVAEGFSTIDDIKDSNADDLMKIEGIEEDTAKALIERAKEFHEKDQEDISQRIKDLGLEEALINLKGLTPGMLVTLGEQKILKLEDFADLASDELTGGYDVVKGERVKIQGYLEDFALSKEEADELIMSARNIVYKD